MEYLVAKAIKASLHGARWLDYSWTPDWVTGEIPELFLSSHHFIFIFSRQELAGSVKSKRYERRHRCFPIFAMLRWKTDAFKSNVILNANRSGVTITRTPLFWTGCGSPKEPLAFCTDRRYLTECLISSNGTNLAFLPCCPMASPWRSAIIERTFTISAVILLNRRQLWDSGQAQAYFMAESIESSPVTVWRTLECSIRSRCFVFLF